MPLVFLLRKYHSTMTKMAIPAIPPTTPPTIAPTGFCVVTVGRPDDVEVEEGSLRDVITPEWEPSMVGVMRRKSTMYALVSLAAVTVMSIW